MDTTIWEGAARGQQRPENGTQSCSVCAAASAGWVHCQRGRSDGDCGELDGARGPGRPAGLVAAFLWPPSRNCPAAIPLLLLMVLLAAEEDSEGLCHVPPFLGFLLSDLRVSDSAAFVGGQSATVTPRDRAETVLCRNTLHFGTLLFQFQRRGSSLRSRITTCYSPGIFLVPDSGCLVNLP